MSLVNRIPGVASGSYIVRLPLMKLETLSMVICCDTRGTCVLAAFGDAVVIFVLMVSPGWGLNRRRDLYVFCGGVDLQTHMIEQRISRHNPM